MSKHSIAYLLQEGGPPSSGGSVCNIAIGLVSGSGELQGQRHLVTIETCLTLITFLSQPDSKTHYLVV